MSSSSSSRATVAIVLMALLATAIPLSIVHAADESQQGDGFVVKIVPRNAAVGDAQVAVTPVVNQYIFDVTVYDADGVLVPVTSWGAVFDGMDPTMGDGSTNYRCAGSTSTSCIYATGGNQAPSPTFTVRAPAAALNYNNGDMPGNGVNFYVVLNGDANGQPMLVDGASPTGHFSLATNALVDQGDFAHADQADQAATPLLLLNGQPDGFVQAGNPLVNPGFELGYSDGSEVVAAASAPYPEGVKVAFAGWYLRNYDVDLPPGMTPASSHHYSASNGTNGGYLSLVYSPDDDGHNLALVQDVGAPNGLAWNGTDSVQVCFDAKGWDAANVMPTFRVAANFFTTEGGSSVKVLGLDGASVKLDYAWHHYCLDFGSQLQGKGVREFYLNFASGTKYSGSEVAHPNARPHLQIDNVQVSGLDLVPGVGARTDLNDGYSVFILPYSLGMADGEGAVQNLVTLANGKSAYVYEIASMDYTSGAARAVDVTQSPNVVFELLDDADVPPTVSDAQGGLWTAKPENYFRTLNADGTVSNRLLVVADPAEFNADTTTGNVGTVPWAFVAQTPDVTYESVYGTSEPSSGYYSPARNALMPYTLADSLDYDATPVALSGSEGYSLAATPTLTISCPGAVQGSSCAASTNQNPLVHVALATTSRVLETLTIDLVSATNASRILGTKTVATPSGGADFQLLAADLANLAQDGAVKVKAVARATTFENGASSSVLDLDNLVPVASFTLSSTSGTRLSALRLVDTSTDQDGTIAHHAWTLTLPNATTVQLPDAGSVVIPRQKLVGAYSISLTTQDNDGATATAPAKTFTLSNIAPTASLSAPAVAPLGDVTFVDASKDSDGTIAAREFSLDGENWTASASPSFVVNAASEGPLTVFVRATDSDGASAIANATVLVDGTAPVTTLALLPDVNSTTWAAQPVDWTVSTTDAGGSGLDVTTISIQSVTPSGVVFTNTTKGASASGTVGADGVHTITAFGKDKAGNLGVVQSRTFKIDTTPPTAAFTTPQFAGPVGGWYVAGENFTTTVAATDTASRVVEVEFFLDGAQPLGTDTDASDGWSAIVDTTGMGVGIHSLTAVALNEAGLIGQTQTVYFVVVGAPAF